MSRRARLPTVARSAPVVAAGLAGAVALSPVLYGAPPALLDGSWVSPPIFWRSSPSGADLLALVTPNPIHPLVRAHRDWHSQRADAASSSTPPRSSLVALAVIGFASWRRAPAERRLVAVTAVLALLALGPFVHVGGVNTHIPGPWALLRYVPVFGLARTPTRFAIVAALALSMLFALRAGRLGRR